MASVPSSPSNVDQYIAKFEPEIQALLQQVRQVVRSAAPDAVEVISYRMPALRLNGILVYFAAFKNHIGFYPPIRGDARLERTASRYAGQKGNLRFPIDRPIPFDLIRRLTELRVKQDLAKAAAGRKTRR
ncbi:MAG: iron chaperone [Burkholderiaceae bacterium]